MPQDYRWFHHADSTGVNWAQYRTNVRVQNPSLLLTQRRSSLQHVLKLHDALCGAIAPAAGRQDGI